LNEGEKRKKAEQGYASPREEKDQYSKPELPDPSKNGIGRKSSHKKYGVGAIIIIKAEKHGENTSKKKEGPPPRREIIKGRKRIVGPVVGSGEPCSASLVEAEAAMVKGKGKKGRKASLSEERTKQTTEKGWGGGERVGRGGEQRQASFIRG